MTATIVQTGATRTIKGAALTDTNFTLSVNGIDTVVSGGTPSTSTVKDRNFNILTGALVNTAGQVIVTNLLAGTALTPVFSSLDTAFASVDAATGIVTYIANGYPRIMVQTPFLTMIQRVYCWQNTGGTVTTFASFVSGSLADSISSAVDTALAVGGASVNMFSTVINVTKTYVRNVNCWLNGIDLSGLCIFNSAENTGEGGGTVVTPLHVIMAAHYNSSYGNGTTLRFLGTDNVVYERTIASSQTIVDSGGGFVSDCQLITLNSPLPAAVSIVPVLPSTYANNIGFINTKNQTPGIVGFWMNQYLQALVFEIIEILDSSGTQSSDIYAAQPSTALRQGFDGTLVVGDSGHAFCWVINGKIVLVGVAHTGGSFPSGSFTTHYASEINTAISGSGYSLTTVDLSTFPTY